MRIENLATLVRNADKVFLIGNGGSYANAAHIANDLLSCNVPAYTLEPSSLTALANDYAYADIFKRWLSVVGEEGDLLIALSGSGRSPNINKAIRKAKQKFMTTVAITGAYNSPCPAARSAHHAIQRGATMQEAEDYQLKLGHALLRELKKL